MVRKILWLRISYWTGAIADAACLVPMLFPEVAKIMFGLSELRVTPEYLYSMRLGAALMLGWTCLLIWADQKPVERKGVILLTIFPVLTGIIATSILAVLSGFITPAKMLPLWVVQGVLFKLFCFSYLNARGKAIKGLG